MPEEWLGEFLGPLGDCSCPCQVTRRASQEPFTMNRNRGPNPQLFFFFSASFLSAPALSLSGHFHWPHQSHQEGPTSFSLEHCSLLGICLIGVQSLPEKFRTLETVKAKGRHFLPRLAIGDPWWDGAVLGEITNRLPCRLNDQNLPKLFVGLANFNPASYILARRKYAAALCLRFCSLWPKL